MASPNFIDALLGFYTNYDDSAGQPGKSIVYEGWEPQNLFKALGEAGTETDGNTGNGAVPQVLGALTRGQVHRVYSDDNTIGVNRENFIHHPFEGIGVNNIRVGCKFAGNARNRVFVIYSSDDLWHTFKAAAGSLDAARDKIAAFAAQRLLSTAGSDYHSPTVVSVLGKTYTVANMSVALVGDKNLAAPLVYDANETD